MEAKLKDVISTVFKVNDAFSLASKANLCKKVCSRYLAASSGKAYRMYQLQRSGSGQSERAASVHEHLIEGSTGTKPCLRA